MSAQSLATLSPASALANFRPVTASALDLPFDDGGFDVVPLQHVAMNIADRPRLYREFRRVLKSGGRFATNRAMQRIGHEQQAAIARRRCCRMPHQSFVVGKL